MKQPTCTLLSFGLGILVSMSCFGFLGCKSRTFHSKELNSQSSDLGSSREEVSSNETSLLKTCSFRNTPFSFQRARLLETNKTLLRTSLDPSGTILASKKFETTDAFIDAFVSANVMWPQMNPGIQGTLLALLLLDPDYPFGHPFENASFEFVISSAQFEKILKAMENAHAAASKKQPFQVEPERLRMLIEAEIMASLELGKRLFSSYLGPDEGSTRIHPDTRYKEGVPALSEARQRWNGETICRFYQLATSFGEFLKSREGRAASKEYRAMVLDAYPEKMVTRAAKTAAYLEIQLVIYKKVIEGWRNSFKNDGVDAKDADFFFRTLTRITQQQLPSTLFEIPN
jgi:hypothetical protein